MCLLQTKSIHIFYQESKSVRDYFATTPSTSTSTVQPKSSTSDGYSKSPQVENRASNEFADLLNDDDDVDFLGLNF